MRSCIAFAGAPGSGKTTQIELLKQRLGGYEVISTGDIARALRSGAYAGRTELDALQRRYDETRDAAIGRGEGGMRIEDVIMIPCLEILAESAEDVILDGFPRSIDQASWLAEAARTRKVAVVDIRLSEEQSAKRMRSRERADDQPETIEKRYALYARTQPQIDAHLLASGVPVHVIDGSGSPEQVAASVAQKLGLS